MRGEAMSRICDRAQADGEPLAAFCALEFFARQGDWQTRSYADRVRELHAWEIDPAHEPALRANFPSARVRIGDSFALAREAQYAGRFNWLVLDNPQMTFGAYCEHFEALELAPLLLASSGVLIFNVNKHPFDYERSPAWQERRLRYYGRDAAQLESAWLLDFYRARIARMGLEVRYVYEEPRNAEYLSYVVAGVSRPGAVA